jgi:hypothetical protein
MMGTMRPSLAAAVLGTLLPPTLAACGLALSGDGAPVEAGLGEAGLFDGSMDTSVADTSISESGAMDSGSDGGEAAVAEAGCTGLLCNGMCLDAGDCRTCTGSPLLCGSRCVSGCDTCTDPSGGAMPIGCFACDSNHANPIGSCQYDDAGSYCLNGDYQGQYQGGPGYQCLCTDGGVASCPGATQVCVPLGQVGQSFCLTCGEPTIGVIQGQGCKAGGSCQESQAVCQ